MHVLGGCSVYQTPGTVSASTQLELRITHVVEKSKDEIGMRIILRQYKKVKGRDLVNADII